MCANLSLIPIIRPSSVEGQTTSKQDWTGSGNIDFDSRVLLDLKQKSRSPLTPSFSVRLESMIYVALM